MYCVRPVNTFHFRPKIKLKLWLLCSVKDCACRIVWARLVCKWSKWRKITAEESFIWPKTRLTTFFHTSFSIRFFLNDLGQNIPKRRAYAPPHWYLSSQIESLKDHKYNFSVPAWPQLANKSIYRRGVLHCRFSTTIECNFASDLAQKS